MLLIKRKLIYKNEKKSIQDCYINKIKTIQKKKKRRKKERKTEGDEKKKNLFIENR